MCALVPLYCLLGVNPKNYIKEELYLLEADLFSRICSELKKYFSEQYKNHYLINFSMEEENPMVEEKFVRLIIQDILLTEEYNIQGIAYYTNTFEEVIEEIISGRNKNPSVIFVQKIIDLHRSVRQDLYSKIIKKIIEQYLLSSIK